MDIVIDFDGTCVTHEFPNVGKEIGAVPILKKLVDKGHRLILFTMRSDVVDVPSPELPGKFTGNFLSDAIIWFREREILLYGIQSNPIQKSWTTSPKAYGQLYIDDAALGCPLIFDSNYSEKPYVDWYGVEKILIERGIL